MILLDTNVLIYASQPDSPFHAWARDVIVSAVANEGAALNAVSLTELCVGDGSPANVAERVRKWGIALLDVPSAAAEECAEAYRHYRGRRFRDIDRPAPTMPLPDFFIGAHAKIMGWELATTDEGRFRTYFPSVMLVMPGDSAS